jgi:hypothetical protein
MRSWASAPVMRGDNRSSSLPLTSTTNASGWWVHDSKYTQHKISSVRFDVSSWSVNIIPLWNDIYIGESGNMRTHSIDSTSFTVKHEFSRRCREYSPNNVWRIRDFADTADGSDSWRFIQERSLSLCLYSTGTLVSLVCRIPLLCVSLLVTLRGILDSSKLAKISSRQLQRLRTIQWNRQHPE